MTRLEIKEELSRKGARSKHRGQGELLVRGYTTTTYWKR